MGDAEKLIESKIQSSLSLRDRSDEINFDFIHDEKIKNELNELIQNFKKDEDKNMTFELITQLMKEQLEAGHLSTVGQILDFLEVLLKLMFVDNLETSTSIQLEVNVFNEFFNLMPAHWETDPVKVHLLTKLIYETLDDFNNALYILSKLIIMSNRLCLYVGLTLFWALYKNFFKTDNLPQKYYKMYKVEKFFKILPSTDEFCNLRSDSMFKFLSLVSIFCNFILLRDDNPNDHQQVFCDFFTSHENDIEKLKNWLQDIKLKFDNFHSIGSRGEQHIDILTLVEMLEFNLLSNIDKKLDEINKI